jgi:hypothetical protein
VSLKCAIFSTFLERTKSKNKEASMVIIARIERLKNTQIAKNLMELVQIPVRLACSKNKKAMCVNV